jgi:hypothetical protein
MRCVKDELLHSASIIVAETNRSWRAVGFELVHACRAQPILWTTV